MSCAGSRKRDDSGERTRGGESLPTKLSARPGSIVFGPCLSLRPAAYHKGNAVIQINKFGAWRLAPLLIVMIGAIILVHEGFAAATGVGEVARARQLVEGHLAGQSRSLSPASPIFLNETVETGIALTR